MSFSTTRFLLTRPLRDVTQNAQRSRLDLFISTHTPLAGRDMAQIQQMRAEAISTHTPLAGRDFYLP